MDGSIQLCPVTLALPPKKNICTSSLNIIHRQQFHYSYQLYKFARAKKKNKTIPINSIHQ